MNYAVNTEMGLPKPTSTNFILYTMVTTYKVGEGGTDKFMPCGMFTSVFSFHTLRCFTELEK